MELLREENKHQSKDKIYGNRHDLSSFKILSNRARMMEDEMREILADIFRKRWVREVLPEMLPRHKWQAEQRPLQVGDVVLIVVPHSPMSSNVRPKALVQAVHTGKDGRVGVVGKVTKSGLLRLSVSRVALITTGDDCCASNGGT